MKNISILGSTGSIGVNALNVVRANRHCFNIVGLAAGKNIDLISKQIEEFNPEYVAVESDALAEKLQIMVSRSSWPIIMFGMEGYRSIAALNNVDLLLSAMSGAAGLLPTLAAIEKGKIIALANKEVMVMAGSLVCQQANASGSMILPVDSEHSAIFQCLLGHHRSEINRIILTASGGPFLRYPASDLAQVTPRQALSHPRWSMGEKVTIDSATLMNKGLEAIEARWLFNVDFDKIHIHIHPQSIVHSLVEYIDGSLIAQLGQPDMKIPISYALSYPDRIPNPGKWLDLPEIGALEFYYPDLEKFPCIRLAYEAGQAGGTMPAVLNAANEVAVKAFIDEKIRFTAIAEIIENSLSLHSAKSSNFLEDIINADAWARHTAQEYICRMN